MYLSTRLLLYAVMSFTDFPADLLQTLTLSDQILYYLFRCLDGELNATTIAQVAERIFKLPENPQFIHDTLISLMQYFSDFSGNLEYKKNITDLIKAFICCSPWFDSDMLDAIKDESFKTIWITKCYTPLRLAAIQPMLQVAFSRAPNQNKKISKAREPINPKMLALGIFSQLPIESKQSAPTTSACIPTS